MYKICYDQRKTWQKESQTKKKKKKGLNNAQPQMFKIFDNVSILFEKRHFSSVGVYGRYVNDYT